MSSDKDRIYKDALGLGERQRADLAARLIDSLDVAFDADASEAWSVEIEGRIQETDADTAALIPWSELRRRLLGQLNDASAA